MRHRCAVAKARRSRIRLIATSLGIVAAGQLQADGQHCKLTSSALWLLFAVM